MGKETYLVLRVSGVVHETYDPLTGSIWRSVDEPREARSFEYKVETLALDAQDYQEMRRDKAVVVAAQPMPLKLIEPVAAVERSAAPAPIHDATWGVFTTGALQSRYAGYGVTVAVLDSGIDADHPAFQGITLIQKDFTGAGNGDQGGHGTHVAGTIFGQTVEGVRYAVAPGVRRALIGKVLSAQHPATTMELAAAIQWAVENGAHIINLSLGFDFPGSVKQWAEQGLEIDLATSRALAQYRDNVRFFDKLVDLLRARAAQSPSALIIAAAGNESRRNTRSDYTIEVIPPAAADGIVAVAALQSASPPHEALRVAPFSNTRPAVAAPGVGIYSAKMGGGFTYLNGTSMASPHVSGVAALWAERQIKRNGIVDIRALDAQLRGNARRDRLAEANYLDIGEGLVTAPLD